MIDPKSGLNSDLLLFDGEKGWRIYAWGARASYETGDTVGKESFVTHACATDTKMPEVYIFPSEFLSHPVRREPYCWRCKVTVPEDVMGLWILHNGIV